MLNKGGKMKNEKWNFDYFFVCYVRVALLFYVDTDAYVKAS